MIGSWKSTGSGSYLKLAKGLFLVRWRPFGVKGPYRKKRIPGTEAEIKEMLARASSNRARRRIGMAGHLTWREAKDTYRDHLTKVKGVTAAHLKEVFRQIKAAEKYSHAPTLNEVEPADLDRWRAALVQDLKSRNLPGWAATANRKKAMLRAFFQFFAKRRIISWNPVDALEPLKQTVTPSRELTVDEYAKVWKKCEPRVQDLTDFLLITGCRISEATRMKFADVDKERRWTILNRKGKVYLRLILPPFLMQIVRRQPKTPDGLVWHRWTRRKPNAIRGHGWVAGVPIGTEWFDALIKERCRLANVPPYSAHDLRHANAQWAKAAGVSTRNSQDLLGHGDERTTERYAQSSFTSGANVVLRKMVQVRKKAVQTHIK